eukprot:4538287-Pleurochrysis_carterae.AAC.1
MTRVTRAAYGNGARPCHLRCLSMHRTRLCAVCVPSLPARTAPLSNNALASGGKPPANATGGSDALLTRRPLRSRQRQ